MATTFSPDYWLCHCEGFLVDSPDGRVGIVEEVRFSSRPDRPEGLSVRSRRPDACSFVVSVGEIEEMLPRAERIVLRAAPRLPECRPRSTVAPPGFGRLEAEGC